MTNPQPTPFTRVLFYILCSLLIFAIILAPNNVMYCEEAVNSLFPVMYNADGSYSVNYINWFVKLSWDQQDYHMNYLINHLNMDITDKIQYRSNIEQLHANLDDLEIVIGFGIGSLLALIVIIIIKIVS